MTDGITRERVDELLRFLPGLERGPWVVAVRGGEAVDARTTTTRYPEYRDDLLAFFRAAGQPWWCDFGYRPVDAGRMLADERAVARATLDEVRSMLTYCVRGERFGDGFWLSVLESGRLVRLLRRLSVLRDTVGQGA